MNLSKLKYNIFPTCLFGQNKAISFFLDVKLYKSGFTRWAIDLKRGIKGS